MRHPLMNHPESPVHPLPESPVHPLTGAPINSFPWTRIHTLPGSALFILLLVGITVLTSCDPSRVYEKNIRIPDGIWYSDHIVHFEVPVEDTISPHNLYVNVRNASLYPMSNLYLFITTTAPSGHSIRDTVQIILADEKGKWKGSGLGDIWDLQQLYKENVRFAQRGTYSFDYQQAMRTDKLPFIFDVGLRVEKAD
jgi:gliding motility-associated lipoprotein GldH